jgi:hypothetical protein
MCEGVFYGERTRRFGALLRRSDRTKALVAMNHPIRYFEELDFTDG